MEAGASTDDGPLLPRPLRPAALVLSAACALVLVGLAIRYHGSDRPGGFDEWVYGNLAELRRHAAPLTRLVDLVPPVSVAVVAVLTVVLAAQQRGRAAALAVLGPGLALLVTEVGKRLVGRRIDGLLALPSGHTTGVTSVVAVIAVLLVGRRARRVHGAAVLGLLVVTLAGAVVGLLMVALHFHHATDVVAGYCVGVAVPLAVALVIDGAAERHPRDSSSSAMVQGGRRWSRG